jgi:ABC-type transporter Mla subunit MlaD
VKRAIAIVAGAAALTGGLTAIGPFGGDEDQVEYRIVLDTALGLTEDADFRSTGVRVGRVKTLELEPRTARAVATVVVEDGDFGTLRRDAECTVQPQSLIGEYYLDCAPGTAAEPLGDGGTVPVERTSGTVPPDLVAQIMTLPYRQRLGILISELGAGVAARGGDVDQAIKRAIPALRETDRVLEILGDERRTLQQLVRDGAETVSTLADGGDEIARFVGEARDTAQASAARRTELQGTIRRFPAFNRGLRSTLADLGEVARRQTPALRDLRAAAPSLTGLLNNLGPFSNASVPALRTLGAASVRGTRALPSAGRTVNILEDLGAAGLEPARNLRIIGDHLDDRRFAVEKNPRSPGGEGFTGFEAFLQYPFVQAQAVNLFDSRGYTLKLNALVNECTQYTDGDTRLDNPERTKRCNSDLGPGGAKLVQRSPASSASRSAGTAPSAPRTTPTPQPAAQQQPGTGAQPQAPATTTPSLPGLPQAPQRLPETLTVPGLPPIQLPKGLTGGGRTTDPAAAMGLLDFLLGSGTR